MKISAQYCLFHVNTTIGSQDMVLRTLCVRRCLKNKLMRNKLNKKVKMIDPHSNYLILILKKCIHFNFSYKNVLKYG